MKISDVMTPCPYKISSDKSLEEAKKFLELQNIRHLPVVEGDQLIGLVSVNDVELARTLCNATGFCLKLAELCVHEPVVVNCDSDLRDVAETMAARKADCVLVVDNDGNFAGIFTTTDACRVVRMLLEQGRA